MKALQAHAVPDKFRLSRQKYIKLEYILLTLLNILVTRE